MEEVKEQTYCNSRGQCTIDREGERQRHRQTERQRTKKRDSQIFLEFLDSFAQYGQCQARKLKNGYFCFTFKLKYVRVILKL